MCLFKLIIFIRSFDCINKSKRKFKQEKKYGKYYIRSGSNSFELKGEELTNFLIEKSGKTWDEFVEEKAGFNDINIKTIDEFKKYAVDRIPSICYRKRLSDNSGKIKLTGK